MTIQLNIEPAVQEMLTARAQARGIPLERLIGEVLEREAKLAGLGHAEQPVDPKEQERRFRLAIAWLADNKGQYIGKWIALQGPHLLATGESAKEVYAQVAGQSVPPLVLRVEEEDPPFAGW